MWKRGLHQLQTPSPTPRKDPSTGGDHFLSQNNAVAKFAKERSPLQSLVDLVDLPSKSDSKPKAVMQAKKKTDTSIGKSVKGWSTMNVHACVACCKCNVSLKRILCPKKENLCWSKDFQC